MPRDDVADIDRASDAVTIDAALVRRLVAGQFPEWSSLDIRPVAHGGWDNRTFHLGDAMLVRLPSAAAYVPQVEKEQRWLPRLAPFLPLPIPVPLAIGRPDGDYPWPWSVYRWLNGEVAATDRIADLPRFARELGEFLTALQDIDTTDGPVAGLDNFHRGGSLAVYDRETRQAIAALEGLIDTKSAMAVWALALATNWQAAPVWIHGDVSQGNLLVIDGELAAVIDFGSSAVGDPACDLAIAWTMFYGQSRSTFQSALPLDAATWQRGRGWTLWKALITLAGLTATNTLEAARSRATITEVLTDQLAIAQRR